MSVEIILTTERLLLRKLESSDLAALCEMHFNEDFMRYLVGGVRKDEAAVRNDLDRYLDKQQRYGFSKWMVLHRETKEIMGRAGPSVIPETDEVDLGYAFPKRFWGQGYATEVARALLNWAKENDLTNRILDVAHAENIASARVLRKVGFTDVGEGTYFGVRLRAFLPDCRYTSLTPSVRQL